MERLQSEVTRFKTMQLKAVKDAEKYKEERDSVFNEYRLIMSERDQVIKEVDKLQTELELAESKLKNTSSEKRVASEEMEALRQVPWDHFVVGGRIKRFYQCLLAAVQKKMCAR